MYNRFSELDVREVVSVKMLASLHMYFGGSSNVSQRAMTEFYHNVSMQALSISNDNVTLEFDQITDLMTNIARLLNDAVEAAIISTSESGRHFASLLDERKKE